MKPGMIVTYRDGRQREVYYNRTLGLSLRSLKDKDHATILSSNYMEDLLHAEFPNMDIVEVTWKRVGKTPKELEIEAVRVEMEKLAKRLKDLEEN